MADVLGLSDVSSKDTGKGKQLKTGNLKRSYNMPKECVKRKMKMGMKRKAAVKACYPAGKPGPLTKIKGKIAGRKVRKSIKKHEKKTGVKLPSYD